MFEGETQMLSTINRSLLAVAHSDEANKERAVKTARSLIAIARDNKELEPHLRALELLLDDLESEDSSIGT